MKKAKKRDVKVKDRKKREVAIVTTEAMIHTQIDILPHPTDPQLN